MSGRYEVLLSYQGRQQGGRTGSAGRFEKYGAAVKERDRQNARAWFRVRTAADLLRSGSFKYHWRVWDHVQRDWAGQPAERTERE